MLYLDKPNVFRPEFEAVGCFLDYDGEFVLLHRNNNKSQGNTWGIPSGKVNKNEDLLSAMVRELFEETNIQLDHCQINFFTKTFVKYSDLDFVYYIFYSKLKCKPKIEIEPNEHNDYRWVSPKDALKLPLVQDLDECIKLYYSAQL